jgi:4-diphosphocytidyl-2-C-methyl-D-erythritol kinase
MPQDEIVISCDSSDIPSDHRNLAYKAADLIKRSYRIKKGVKIRIKKKIPVAAGLGGGSSNAAAVLLGLNKLFALRLDSKALIMFANKLGSDVAFFILDKKFALGTARGGDLEPVSVPKNAKLWHLLFVPAIKVMTKDVYGLVDKEEEGKIKAKKPQKSLKLTHSAASGVNTKRLPSVSILRETKVLTKKRYDVNILLSYLRQRDILLLNQNVYNRLSATVMKSYSLVSALKSDLLQFGLKSVHMSGSGPTLFTIFKTQKEAQLVFAKIRSRFLNRCSIFLASTM